MSIKTISEQNNYTAIDLGNLADLGNYEHKGPDGKLFCTGKVFLKDAIKSTGSQISYNLLLPGQGAPFFHSHTQNEEVYCFISGNGEYQVGETVFPIKEGSVVRVGTNTSHSLKNTGSAPLIFLCIQNKEGSLSDERDGVIEQTEPKFSK
ncbi:cupin 2 barrel domain-containing protein [Tritrichomonas foetus]|uniref:Cupin 2 barrel domain-containing protein n=1 Tax=Tritrichomonas foetus TaxID=1144522 RepID=A0A1J4KGJ9_9EUKA|nr:cupin 2 barrel domain-containing protein [Tritrichomonas foetus]|eukprot:OHT08453.1 cupin 2 barrel domain-containing protein [Tritrichomonas foetus]